jgi:hypothetical protein
MSKEEEKIKFKALQWKLKSPTDTIEYELEDGTKVKVRFDLVRAGVAINYLNPDGSPNYNIAGKTDITIVPTEKEFELPKSQIGAPPSEKKRPGFIA